MIDTSRNMMYHLSNLNAENERVTYQMATGKILDKGSDDSLLYSTVIDIEDKLRVTEALKLQITKSNVMNETADAALAEIKVSLDDIKVDLLKGLNSGMQRSDKLALATNLRGIRENIIDRMNGRVDGEYIFTGSDTTRVTLLKDPDYEDNGKINYNGDGFLREVAVQPGSYRDRGITAYEASFYNFDSYDRVEEMSDPLDWDGVGISGEQVVFQTGDRIIDQDGFEWKMNDIDGNHTKLQKYDYNGVMYNPPIEIDLYMTAEPNITVDLGIGSGFSATGGELYELEIDGNTYSYTAAAGDDENTIFGALSALITVDGYTVEASLHNDDKFFVSSTTPMSWSTPIGSTTVGVSNELEASTNTQSRQATYVFDVPVSPVNLKFEAKHNYFDDLNITINALEGYATKLDGTKAGVIDDEVVRQEVAKGLEQTTLQFNSTNIGHGELGGRNKVFDVAYEKLLTQETHYNILIQETNGADLAKLSMESQALELTYNSLYTTISKMNNLTLLNFID